MTDKFKIEYLTKYTCLNCGSIIEISMYNLNTKEACFPSECPACATGDIHIDSTPLRRAVDNIGMRCW